MQIAACQLGKVFGGCGLGVANSHSRCIRLESRGTHFLHLSLPLLEEVGLAPRQLLTSQQLSLRPRGLDFVARAAITGWRWKETS